MMATARQRTGSPWRFVRWGAVVAFTAAHAATSAASVSGPCDGLAKALQQRFSLDAPVHVEDCRPGADITATVRVEQVRFDGGAALELVVRSAGRRLSLAVRAWAEVPVWIAVRDLAAGTTPGVSDVRTGQALLPLADALSPRPPLSQDWRLRRRIPRGEAILARDLRSGNEIAAGDVCEISFQRGAVRVRTRAVVRRVLRGGRQMQLERIDTHRRIVVSPDSGVSIIQCEGGTG